MSLINRADNIPRAKEAYQHAASLDPQNVHALEGKLKYVVVRFRI